MNNSAFDRAARAIGTAPSRRGVLHAMIGIALSGATGLVSTVPGQAADEKPSALGPYGSDVAIEANKKKKRCKKNARRCNVDVAGWCGAFWLDYGSCVASLGSCCSFLRKCKNGSANSCIANNPYYFLV